tara:strand:- start:697 stop:1383 length:687 start_codon:yes stop_codon:yes gene_type:complete
MSETNLDGKVVVITGAAGALGKAVVEAFANERTTIAQLDVIPIDNDHYSSICDLTNAKSCADEIKKIIQEFAKVDVVANIAGGFSMGETVYETTPETWDHMFNLNTLSVLNMARAAIPQMIKQRSGRLINVSAMAALHGASLMGSYSASKSAVIRLTEALAEEVREKGIAVNCVLPSIIDTPRNRDDMPDANFSNWVLPEELADIIVFLGSPLAAPINGAAIPVRGLS